MNSLRVLSFLIAWYLLIVGDSQAQDTGRGFVKRYCVSCHGADAQEAGLRIDQLADDYSQPEDFSKWVLIHDRIASGEMPPEGADQAGPSAKTLFVSSLKVDLLAAEKSREETRGRGLVRRMNRTEYEHTLQDLLSLPLLHVKELLPEDGQQHGFDKVPGALELSHVQIRKYLEAADKALRQAIVESPRQPESVVWRQSAAEQNTGRAAIAIHAAAPLQDGKLASELSSKIMGNPNEDWGNTYRAAVFGGQADSVVVLSGVFGAHQPQGLQPDRFRVQTGGWHRVRFSTWGLRWNRGSVEPAVRGVIRKHIEYAAPYKVKWKPDPLQRWVAPPLETPTVRETEENIEFYGDAEVVHVVRASLNGKVLGFFDAPSLKPTEHELTVWLEPGERVSFHVMTLPATGPMNSGTANGVRSYEGPGVAFDWFEMEGPLVETWPPQSQQRLFGKTPIGRFPRPVVADRPVIGKDNEAVAISHKEFIGAGHKLETEWYLNIAGEISTTVNFAIPGTYEFRVNAYQTKAGDEPAELWTKLNGREMKHGRFKVEAERSEPKVYKRTFEVESAGPADIGVEFPNDYFDEKTKADRNLVLTGFEIAPVKVAGASSPSSAEDSPTAAPSPGDLLLNFAESAFRRPVKPVEIVPYTGIVNEQLQAGQSFKEAMIAGYKAMLCSPDFLFLGLEDSLHGEPQATAPEQQRRRLRTAVDQPIGPTPQYALASRLSYFLWNSLPDERLLSLAASGELANPDTLMFEVDRLLSDPRSDRFIDHFLDEWLEMKDIDFTTPDKQLYPEFDPWLRDSMLAEVRAYFRKLITENRSVDHIVDSDFILINQRLAELYNIKGVAGSQLREVKLPKDDLRGGLLTQAAVLKVTANGTATSPVLRGVWVTERILGIPRRPPPPNIPAVEPDATGAVTIREQIEKHRADPACASCHRIMDPPGLALEGFDVIGGWRDRYRASGRPKMIGRGKDRKLEPHVSVLTNRGNRMPIRLSGEVDPSGVLPDGRSFDDVNGFRALLLANREQLARNLARQLMIYATGKGYRFSDRDVIDSIVADCRDSAFGVRSLVHGVVGSALFRQNETLGEGIGK